MYFACPAGYAGIVVYNNGFLAFKTRYFPQFEHRGRAYVRTDAISVTFRIIHSNVDHFLASL